MPGTPASPAMRAVCITVWPKPKVCLYELTELPDQLQYVYFGGEETCPETGNKHKHVYAYANNRGLRLNGWKKIFGKQCHVEQARGSPQQAIDYCKKEAEGVELGEKPMENGVRRSVQKVLELLETGERPTKIARKNPDLFETVGRYGKLCDRIHLEVSVEKMISEGYVKKTVIILQGAPGAGKNRSIYAEHGYDVWKSSPTNGRHGVWFDMYTGQSVAVFDECSPSSIMPITDFLRLTDGYPEMVPIKGAFAPWRPTTIYFTSNIDYTKWWGATATSDQLTAAKRRVTEVRVFKPDGSIVIKKCP